MKNLMPYFNREVLGNKVISYIIIAVMIIQLILDVLGKFLDFLHKL